MADIVSNRAKINDIEISSDAPITEALCNKLAADINDYLDKSVYVQVFTANNTWTVPAYATMAIMTIVGGGGGGAGGAKNLGASTDGGGGGGGSGAPIITKFKTVSEGEIYTIEIGAGGAGGAGGSLGGSHYNGYNGSDGSLSRILSGSTVICYSQGGKGGEGGGPEWDFIDFTKLEIGGDGGTAGLTSQGFFSNGGKGSNANAGGPASGDSSPWGGKAGALPNPGNGTGGSGGASYGDGGNNGSARTGAGIALPPTVGGYGAGGGGGGGGRATLDGAPGAAGGPGICVIYWYGNA